MASRAAEHTTDLPVKLIVGSIIFFLIFLGMRIPYLKGDFSKPKQRPRATLSERPLQETQVKPEKSPSLAVVPTLPMLPAQVEIISSSLPLPSPHFPVPASKALAPSRASPPSC